MKKIITITLMSVIAIGSTVAAQTWVNGYYRDNGTYVSGHFRSAPDNSPYNNFVVEKGIQLNPFFNKIN